ncbi:MAG: Ig-like domain-containing protein, partial [Bacteroidota bacterium]
LASVSFSNDAQLATPAVPTISSVAADCTADEISSISNYDASATYTFSPTGPSVGALGLISGMVGTTSYTVTASNGSCTSLASVSFSNDAQLATPAVPTITTNNGLALTCAVPNTTLTASAGASYLWSTGATTQSIDVSTAGTFTVTVTNGNCSATNQVVTTLNQSTLVVNAVATDAVCGGANGSAALSATGGNGSYTFTSSGGSLAGSTLTAAAGFYTITATDGNGCSGTTNVTIGQSMVMAVDAGPDKTINCLVPTAQIGPAPVAGNTYSWTPSLGLSNPAIANPIANPAINTVYILTVTNAAGCITIDDVLVKVDKLAPSAGIINDGLELSCIKTTAILKGTGGLSYLWSTGETTETITVSTLGIFGLTVTGANGCTAPASNTTFVNPGPISPKLDTLRAQCTITVTKPIIDACGTPVTAQTIDPLTYSVQGEFTIHWVLTDGIGNTVTANQVVVIKDTIKPVPSNLLPISGEGTVVVPIATAVDNCSGNVIGTTTDPLVYTVLGPHTVRWTFTDAAGNTSTANQIITVLKGGVSTNPDMNVTLINVPVTGNLNTNDYVTFNSKYSNPVGKMGNPNSNLPTINTNGTYSFVSELAGVYVFEVKICEPLPSTDCTKELLFITVIDPDSKVTPPIANVDLASTMINKTVVINTLANDKPGMKTINLVPNSVSLLDMNGLLLSGVSTNGGIATVNTINGNISYTPPTGFVGTDSLKYSVCDNQAVSKCAIAYQIIRVLKADALNSTYASDDFYKTEFNTQIAGNVKSNDVDPNGNITLTTAQTTAITNKGKLTLGTNGSFTFVPDLGFFGPVEFAYSVCDDGTPGACASATLHLLVMPPILNTTPDVFITFESVEIADNLAKNDDVSAGTTYGTPIALGTNPSASMPVINANGTFTFVSDKAGVYQFDIKVCSVNPPNICKVERLSITVLKPTVADNPPIANDDIVSTAYATPITINTLANDLPGQPINVLVPSSTSIIDLNGAAAGVSVNGGTATVDPTNGKITYTPAAGFEGVDTLQYSICDNQLMPKCATAYQIIAVSSCIPRPTNLIATANSATEIRIKYTDNSFDEIGFEIYWSNDGNNWQLLGNRTTENTTTLIFSTGWLPETKYYFRVRAVGENCYSIYSNVTNVTTLPPAPVNLAANGVKVSQVDLSWTNTSKTATGIEMQAATITGATSDSTFVTIKTLNTVPNADQVKDLLGSTKYRYRIRYISPSGFSAWSNIADATTLIITALEEELSIEQILIYPNPAKEFIYLKPLTNVVGKITTRIYNEVGIQMLSQDFNGFAEGRVEKLNVSNCNYGIYFLEISNKKGKIVKKVLIQ